MPTNTPLPTVSTGATIAASTTNDAAVLNTCVGLLGKGGVLSGSAPATTAPNFQIQAGTDSVTFTSGFGTISLPTTFPNGVLAVCISVETPTGGAELSYNTVTTSSVQCVLCFSGTAYSGNANISFIVIGF